MSHDIDAWDQQKPAIRLCDRLLPTNAFNAGPESPSDKNTHWPPPSPDLRFSEALLRQSIIEVDSCKPIRNLGDLGIIGTDHLKVLNSIKQHQVFHVRLVC